VAFVHASHHLRLGLVTWPAQDEPEDYSELRPCHMTLSRMTFWRIAQHVDLLEAELVDNQTDQAFRATKRDQQSPLA
jgi:hypothetical protein